MRPTDKELAKLLRATQEHISNQPLALRDEVLAAADRLAQSAPSESEGHALSQPAPTPDIPKLTESHAAYCDEIANAFDRRDEGKEATGARECAARLRDLASIR